MRSRMTHAQEDMQACEHVFGCCITDQHAASWPQDLDAAGPTAIGDITAGCGCRMQPAAHTTAALWLHLAIALALFSGLRRRRR